jgi:hypothetical protein
MKRIYLLLRQVLREDSTLGIANAVLDITGDPYYKAGGKDLMSI